GGASKAWGVFHDDALIPARKRLYLTATTRIGEEGDSEFVSMDDSAVYGPVVYELSVMEAIQDGLLADYRVVVPVITASEAQVLLDAHPNLAGDDRVTPGQIALAASVVAASEEYGMSKIMSFHSRVAHTAPFSEAVGTVAAH